MATIRNTVLSLGGETDYLDCGSIDFAQHAYTVEAWFRCSDKRGGELLAATINNGHGVLLEMDDTGLFRFLHRNPPGGAGGTNLFTDGPRLDDGQWHHFAAVKGTSLQLFIDGVKVKSGGSVASFTGPLDVLIAKLTSTQAGVPFNGMLTEVRLWSVARTADDLATFMHRMFEEPQAGLVGYWPLHGSLKDQSGHRHNATSHGTAWVTDTSLQVFAASDPIALWLDGVDDYVDCGKPVVTTAVTAEAWIEPHRSNGVIIGRGGGWGADGFAMTVHEGQLRVEMQDSTLSDQNERRKYIDVALRIDTVAENPKRRHVAFTWSADSQTVRVYIDGTPQQTTATFKAAAMNLPAADNLTIGANPAHGLFFKGHMAEVRLWDVERSPQEILATMNHRLWGNEDGLVGYWPLDRPGRTAEQRAGGSAAGRLADGTLLGGALFELAPKLQFARPIVPNAVLAFDGTNIVVPEATAAGRHGIRHGGVWVADTDLNTLADGQIHCLQLNGSTDFVDCGPGPIVADALTVEAWVKHDGGNGHIVNRGGGWETDGYSLFLRDGKVRVELQNRKAKKKTMLDDDTPFPPDKKWHHVAFTWQKNPGTVTIYIDGMAKKTGSFTESIRLPGQHLNIGRNAQWEVEHLFKGRVSEVRIWDVARTATEIAAAKGTRLAGNEAGLVGYWPLDGVNEYAFAAPAPDRRGPVEAFTVELWARTVGPQQSSQELLFSSGRFAIDGVFWIELDAGSGYRLAHAGGNQAIGMFNAGLWHHIAVACDVASGTLRTYLDGRETSAKTALQPAFFEYLVGGNFLDRRGFIGEIADLRIWNVARTAKQIEANRKQRLSGGESGLVAYFPFTKGYGNTDMDEAGGALAVLLGATWKADADLKLDVPATDHGEAPDRKPMANASLALDGRADYLDCGSIDFAQGFYTIEAWFRCGDKRGGELLTATIKNQHGVFLGLGGDGQMRFVHRNPPTGSGGADLRSTTGARVDDGQWHHCAAVKGDTLKLYIDGVEVKSGGGGSAFSGPLDVLISRLTPGQARVPFNGLLREVRLWNVARTAEQIKAMKDSRLWGNELGLVAYWPLDSGVYGEKQALDKVGSHHATVHGTTWSATPPLALGPAPPETAPVTLTLPSTANPATALTVPKPVPAGTELDTSNLPPWLKTLVTEVRTNTGADNSLTIQSSTLSGFDLFSGLGGLLLSALPISNLQLELLTAAEKAGEEGQGAGAGAEGGEGPDAAASAGTDGATQAGTTAATDATATTAATAAASAGTTPGSDAGGDGPAGRKRRSMTTTAGLRLSGDVDVLGLTAAAVAIEFSAKTDQSKAALVKIKGGGSESKSISELLGGTLPDELVTVLDILGGSVLSAPSFAFATESLYDSEAPFDVGVSEGFNFYGTLDVTTAKKSPGVSLGKMLAFVAGLFDVKALTVHVALNKTTTGLSLELNAVVDQNLKLIDSKYMGLVYRGAVVSLAMSGSPPEPSLSFSNAIDLTLTFVGANDLRMTGTLTGEAESITASYTLQTYDGAWHPFDIDQLSVKAMALEIGGTYAPPWIDNFGFAVEKATIGTVTASMAIKIDSNDPDAFVFVLDVEKITALELISCFSPLTFLAWQALPGALKNPLEKIIAVKLTEVLVSIVPVATSIGELMYEDEGITVTGKLDAWGWQAALKVSISPSRVDIFAEMDPINFSIGNVVLFAVEGALDTPKPTFKLYLGTEEMPEFFMSVTITLLTLRTAVYAKLDKDGLQFIIEQSLPIGRVALGVIADSSKVEARGAIDFGLNVSIPIPGLGDLQLVDVAFHASAHLKIDTSFFLKIEGSLRVYGKYVSVSLTIDETLSDFEAILDALITYLKEQALNLFGALWDTLEEWANAVADGAILFAGSVADAATTLGEASVETIVAAANIVGESAADIAAGLKSAGTYTAEQVAEGLESALVLGQEGVATAMKAANYTADEVAKGLDTAYDIGAEGVATAMKGAGFAMNEVSEALDYALDQTERTIESALKGAGYAVETVSTYVEQTFVTIWKPVESVGSFFSSLW